MMRRILLLITLAIVFLTATQCNKVYERPNIVFLLSDDQTGIATGCYGNHQVVTPNMDNLAREGIMFTNHYNTSAICMASRVSILTGMYEYKAGCNFMHGDLTVEKFENTYPVILQNAGYFTGFAGKVGFDLDVKESDKVENKLPVGYFDMWGGGPGQTHYSTAKNPTIAHYADKYPHSTRAYGAWADDFIKAAKKSGKPFCMSISFKAPHLPFTPDVYFDHVYAGKKYEKPANYGAENAKHLAPQAKSGRQYNDYGFWRDSEESYQEAIQSYNQLIHGVDYALGMIRKSLEENGVADNTIIIYTSDNGYSCGAHNLAGKVLPYEEASKSPLIIFDPRLPENKRGVKREMLTANIDMAPTILSYAGIEFPENMDGENLLPVVNKPNGINRTSVALTNMWGNDEIQALSVVTTNWKYIYWQYSDDRMQPVEELFNIGKDRLEMENLAANPEYIEKLNEMRNLYDEHYKHLANNVIDYNDYMKYKFLFNPEASADEKKPYLTGTYEEIKKKPDKKLNAQPNVVVVITDDQGYGDLGCLGNNIIKTPSIDKFYEQSLRLTDYHVSPTCAPTRSALMTGRYSNRVGVWHTIAGRSLLWEDEVTMADIFAENGYTNGLFGKWHLGDNFPFRPEDRGFHEVVVHGGGGITQGPDFWGNDYFEDSFHHNGEFEKYEGYCTDVYFDKALDFIEQNRNNTFFCWIATNAPHGPLNVPEKYHKIYEDEQQIIDKQRRFYGMITNIDDNFERLRKKLKELKLERNTILIFMTDNGTAYGIRTINGKEYGNTGGMRGMKNSEYEGGHRVPFFIRWPEGNLPEGKDINTLTAHIDILPTLIELCGLDHVTAHKPFNGTSLAPLLKGDDENWKERMLIVDSQRRKNLVKWRKSAVMDEKWRLVNGKELYDIIADPKQKKDIAADFPAEVERMRAGYNAWWESIISEGANERYAYIQAGSDAENPLRISAHDMHTESTLAHSQVGPLLGHNPLGIFKIEILEEGDYTISLCRYPRESGLAFEDKVAAVESNFELEKGMPAGKPLNITEAKLSIAQYDVKSPVKGSDKEVAFDLHLFKGKYDLDAHFINDNMVKYPPYYIYIEKK